MSPALRCYQSQNTTVHFCTARHRTLGAPPSLFEVVLGVLFLSVLLGFPRSAVPLGRHLGVPLKRSPSEAVRSSSHFRFYLLTPSTTAAPPRSSARRPPTDPYARSHAT